MAENQVDVAKPKNKHSRLGLFLPIGLFLIAALLWSGYWFYTAHQIETRLAEQAKTLTSKGYQVAHAPFRVEGYPFRMFLQLKDVRLIAPNGKGLAVPALEAEASMIDLDKWMFVAKTGLTLYRGKGSDQSDLGQVAVTGDALRVSVSGWTQPSQTIGLEGLNATFTPSKPERPFILQSAKHFEGRLSPNISAVDTLIFSWDMSGAQAHPQTLLGRLGQGQNFNLRFQGQMAQASKFRGDLNGWREAGGAVRQVQASLHVGDLEVFGRSEALLLDPNLALSGPLGLEVKGTGDPFAFLLGAGLISAEYEPLARAFVGTKMTADKPVKLDFVFRDGGAYVGPLRVAAAPVIR